MSLVKWGRNATLACAGLSLAVVQPLFAASVYTQSNLTSDIPGMAQHTDPNLKNPWGVSFAATSPFWVSNQVSGNSTLYDANGAPVPSVVSTPGSPTGQVFNGTGQFLEPGGSSPLFLFATLAGTIDGWNPANGTTALTLASTSGATFTGLALANNGLANYLHAADALGGVNVFNSSFKPVTLSGSFTDPGLPKGYTPYTIQAIGGMLYVEYSLGVSSGSGLGIVNEFDANGNFVKRLITGGVLNAPWGVATAPSGFGQFGGDLLVGNFGNGEINAFNSSTGAWIGTLDGADGSPVVNSGLWSLSFRSASGFNPDSLYFTAGINGQKDGLFGSITPTPEPATFLLGALGVGTVLLLKQVRG